MLLIFHTIFYQPLYNLLIFTYNEFPLRDFGIAVILVTIVVKLILYPFSLKSIKAQRSMLELQPKINSIRERFKNDKQGQAQQLMALYKDHKVNPFSSCLPLIIQLPFLFALYKVFMSGLQNSGTADLYPFVTDPGVINSVSLGLIDLANPSYVLAILAGLAQFVQAKYIQVQRPAVDTEGSKDESIMSTMNKQMLYMMPIMTIIIGTRLPGGLALYWLVTTVLTQLQQWITLRKKVTTQVSV
jgi:YidC/Oxa1 family membrane protein insertase